MSLDIRETFDRARDEAAYKKQYLADFVVNEGRSDNFDKTSSVILGGDGAARRSALILQETQKRQKDNTDTQILLSAINNAQVISDQLGKDIARLEDELVKQHGEEWREKVSLWVLGPDEMPERMDGENIEDYRERLEPILIKKMLDEDGQIKQRYLDDPNTTKAARWAQKQYDKQNVDRFIDRQQDTSVSQEQRLAEGQEWVDSASYSRTRSLAQASINGAEVNEEVLEKVAEKTNDLIDSVSDVSLETGFMTLG